MILTFVFVAISLAADVFMLTFLNATARELRPTGTRVVEKRAELNVAVAKQERLHRPDCVA